MAIGGSYPNPRFELYIRNRVNCLFPNHDCTILDVGPGNGKYGRLLKAFAKRIDAIEIFPQTLKVNQINELYYQIFVGDICDFEFEHYDIVIFGDVLEHIETARAQQLLDRIYDKCKEIIVVVPYLYEQGETDGNVHEIHLQPDLTHEVFLKRYPHFKCLATEEYQGIYIKK